MPYPSDPRLAAADQQIGEDETGHEAADVGHVRHAAGLLTDGEGADAVDELEDGPHADGDDGRDRHQEPEDEDGHAVRREQDDVGAQDAGDGAGRAEAGDDRARIDEDVRQAADDAGGNVEERVGQVADAVLDVVAEDPQEEHVAGEVEPAAVHEDAREERQPDRRRPRLLGHLDGLAIDRDRLWLGQIHAGRDLEGDRAVAVRELGALGAGPGALQEQEDEDVDRDEGERHEGGPVPALVLVADREHRADDRAGTRA